MSKELELLEAWTNAVEQQKYEAALALLEDWLRQQQALHTPFARHVMILVSISATWAGRAPAAHPMNSNLDEAHCSFCGKKHDAVKKLIAGAVSFICDECVTLFAGAKDVGSVSRGAKPAGVLDVCSFCGQKKQGADALIAGPGALICRKCVDICAKVLKAEPGQ